MDVFLEPLLEEMKKLWVEGVAMWNEFHKETFTLKAITFVTINDYPAPQRQSNEEPELKSNVKITYPLWAHDYSNNYKDMQRWSQNPQEGMWGQRLLWAKKSSSLVKEPDMLH